MGEERTPHGILRTPNSRRRSAGVRWDEANIVETSVDAGTRMRIDEPKTPWVGPVAAQRALSDDEPFELSPGEASPATSGSSSATSAASSSSSSARSESESEAEVRHAAFEAARRSHYRMEAVRPMDIDDDN